MPTKNRRPAKAETPKKLEVVETKKVPPDWARTISEPRFALVTSNINGQFAEELGLTYREWVILKRILLVERGFELKDGWFEDDESVLAPFQKPA